MRELNSSQQLIGLWYWAALAVSIIFVLALPVRWYFPEFLRGIVGSMQLTMENNLGAWWSGVLLFMLAIHAYDASVAMRDRVPQVARAWAILAGILLFFSADEIGSMHERLGLLGGHLGISGWALLLPIGAIIGIFLLYALYSLWQHGGECRRYVVPLFIGFGLLGSVAIQEYIEHAVEWGSGAIVMIRDTVEEGTELLGMIILLRVMLRPSMEIASRPVPSRKRFFTLFPEHARIIFIVLLALVPVFTLLTVLLDDHRGRLADWLAVSAFLTAGLLAFSRVMSGETAMPGRLTGIAALCLLASATTMYYQPDAIAIAAGFETSKRILVLAVIGLLICGLWLATAAVSRNLAWLLGVFSVLLLLAPILSLNATYVFVMTQCLAVLTLLAAYLAVEYPAAFPAAGAVSGPPAPRVIDG